MKSKHFLILFLISAPQAFSQTLFYEDEFKGGATASGGSPGAYITYTPSDFEVYIPPGSTIRKAFLFGGRHGNAPDTEVDLNGFTYTFDETNQVSDDFSSPYGGTSGVHAIDVTADIDPDVSDYTLEVVDTYSGPLDIYLDFYLFITYENPTLDSTFVSIYVNGQDFDDPADDPWEINLPQPMDTTCVDIGLSFMTGYACYMSDGEDAYVNDIYIGTWGGNEDNSGDCGGPVGSFTYYDGDLLGLMDDDEDEVVDETDVIATINEYITVGSSYLELNFDYVDGGSGESSNAIWAAAIIYGEGAELVDSLVTAGEDALICKGDTVQISATGFGDFEWTPAGSLSDAFINDPLAFPSSTTTYFVSVDNGCFADIDSLTVVVDEFAISLTDEIEICIGENINIGIDSEAGVTYAWQPADFLDDAGSSDPVTSATENITYFLTAINENGCISEDEVDIIVNSANVVAGNDTIILLGGTANIFALGDGVVYQWQPADYLDCADCAEAIASPPVTTTYVIMITDEDGCIDFDSVTIEVDTECGHLIHFPNAFSPNGDNVNDLFSAITFLPDVELPELNIYNRWGELIFHSIDIAIPWNGEFNGKLMPLGNYPYTFTFNCFGEPQKLRGSIMLVR
ncbi:MAG: gliding motility-associated C-terminal domain-containing protein [Chitinophagales bacterium]|nr:gliding motility-associated C-terminal domain-containing protein [Chitinophagales bacterium]